MVLTWGASSRLGWGRLDVQQLRGGITPSIVIMTLPTLCQVLGGPMAEMAEITAILSMDLVFSVSFMVGGYNWNWDFWVGLLRGPTNSFPKLYVPVP